MLEFAVKNLVPPGGRYFYVVPETDVYVESCTMRETLQRTRQHYLDNSRVAPDNLEELVEDYMCRHLPEGFCFGDDDGRPRARVVTMRDIRAATEKAVKGSELVDIGEARNRGFICGKCPMNDRTLCPTCVGLVSWARRLIGRKLGAMDEVLGVCTVDCSANAAKVHVKDPQQPRADNLEYPDNCWMRQEGDVDADTDK